MPKRTSIDGKYIFLNREMLRYLINYLIHIRGILFGIEI